MKGWRRVKPIVTVTNMFPEAALEKLGPHCDLRTNQTENPPAAQDLKKYASESMVIVTYLTDRIDRDIINCAENLKLIANYGAGFNNIDVAHAVKKGIWVTNTPGVLHETTADLTWAMILGAARRIVPSDRFTRESRFRGWQAKMFRLRKLALKAVCLDEIDYAEHKAEGDNRCSQQQRRTMNHVPDCFRRTSAELILASKLSPGGDQAQGQWNQE